MISRIELHKLALKQNKREYLQEIAGGGLSGIAAAVAIKHVALTERA